MKLPGLNIQAPWARLLLDGSKTIETRTYPLPQKHIGQDMWLIETPGKLGSFKARVIGVIRFSGCKRYETATTFNDDIDLHLVPPNDPGYAWRKSTPKYGWIVDDVRAVKDFEAPTPRGIVYSRPFDKQQRF